MMRRHHRCKGKSGSQLHSMATKWSLKVPMAFSAALFRCRFGGTSCHSTWFVRKNCFMTSGHSLSKICIFGCKPLAWRYLWIVVIARSRSCAALVLNGSAMMALLSWSYATMIYCIPRLDVLGKRPVWSVNSFPVMGKHCTDTMFCRTPSVDDGVVMSLGASGEVFVFCWVDRMFCRICRMWPFVVAADFGRCFFTSCVVRLGHVV